MEVNAATVENMGKFLLYVVQFEKADNRAGLEFHQDIHIALWTEVLAQNGAEK